MITVHLHVSINTHFPINMNTLHTERHCSSFFILLMIFLCTYRTFFLLSETFFVLKCLVCELMIQSFMCVVMFFLFKD